MSEDPGPDSEVEEPRQPEQVEVSVSGGVTEEIILCSDQPLFKRRLTSLLLLRRPHSYGHPDDGDDGIDGGHVEQGGWHIVQYSRVSEVRGQRGVGALRAGSQIVWVNKNRLERGEH